MTDSKKTFRLLQGDITTLAVDAIVNSANKSLLGGAGVDRAIHRAAGRELLEACLQLDGCPIGESRLTPGFRLPAHHVIHSVGPVWLGGWDNEDEKLASAYRSALDITQKQGFQSIAFPCISCGVHRFPTDRAADIAIATVKAHPFSGTVIFCCKTSEAYLVYVKRLSADETANAASGNVATNPDKT